MAEIKATSGENEATATVKVRRVTHVTAYISRGHVAVRCTRIKLDSQGDINCGEAVIAG